MTHSTVVYDATTAALKAIRTERERQDQLKAAGRFEHTCADPEMTDLDCLPILGEEYGEVCKALCEKMGLVNDLTKSNLRKELIQVAAVATAWIERLDRSSK